MVWTPQVGAPATFSLKQAMAAMVAGTEADWLTAWMFWIPDTWFDTTAFCLAGPPPPSVAIDLVDLLGAATARKSPVAWALVAASVMPKLQAIADERVFAAYCQSGTAAAWCTLLDRTWTSQPGGWADYPSDDTGPRGSKLLPAGATQIRMSGSDLGGGGLSDLIFRNVSGTITGSYTFHIALGQETFAIPATSTEVVAELHGSYTTPHIVLEYDCSVPVTTTPTSQPEPANAPPAYLGNTYTTIADLGAELDRHEYKLDIALDALRWLSSYQALPTGLVGDVVDVVPGVTIPTMGANACRVTVAGVPAATSEDFTTPVRFRNLGHMTRWTVDGPLGPLPLEHNPEIFLLDPRVISVSVNPMEPATSTVEMLYPVK